MEETRWKQVNITYAGQDSEAREREAVAHLAGVFPTAEDDGLVTSWFFIRKGAWRVRYLLSDAPNSGERGDPIRPLLTDGVTWACETYEPEVHAFGGWNSMDAAHELFHADSRYLLGYLSSGPIDRKERSLVLCTALMRAAGLDLNEQGDVWARVAEQRAALLGNLPDQETWRSFTGDVLHLFTGRARRDDVGSDWLTAFEKVGATISALRSTGRLTRGIRATIALHIIFHWNRMGISGAIQAVLARAAKEAIFGSERMAGR